MTDVQIGMHGLDELSRRFTGAERIVGEELRRAVDRSTLLGERESKLLAPVVTGHLRRSITAERATFAGGVARGRWGTNVPYARIVHEGRGPVVANPARNHPVTIVPVTGQALKFTIGGRTVFAKKVVIQRSAALKFTIGGRTIYRKRVNAARGKPFLTDAARRLRGRVRHEFEEAAVAIARRLVGGP